MAGEISRRSACYLAAQAELAMYQARKPNFHQRKMIQMAEGIAAEILAGCDGTKLAPHLEAKIAAFMKGPGDEQLDDHEAKNRD